MHSLLYFILRYSSVLLFIFLEIISFYLIFTHNAYQKSVYLNSSNYVVGKLYETTSEINAYFGLKSDNEKLLEANGNLKNEILALENHIFELTKDSIKVPISVISHNSMENEYIVSRVIKNSIHLNNNYITVNKGIKDSVSVGMAAISESGVVGEVIAASKNFAIIQPLLNTNSNYSCKLKNSNVFGPFHWDGKDSKYVLMNDFPSYEAVNIGDTVVTSGYSDVFPADILIGTVKDIKLDAQANNYDLLIELSTNFNTLKNVLIVKKDYQDELNDLDNFIHNDKN